MDSEATLKLTTFLISVKNSVQMNYFVASSHTGNRVCKIKLLVRLLIVLTNIYSGQEVEATPPKATFAHTCMGAYRSHIPTLVFHWLLVQPAISNSARDGSCEQWCTVHGSGQRDYWRCNSCIRGHHGKSICQNIEDDLLTPHLQVSRSVYARLEYQVKVCARGILIISIYDKLQRLGVDKLADSAAVTLMSADVGGFQQAMVIFHSTWASLLELGLGIYVLYRFVGYACFLIFIPTISKTFSFTLFPSKY